MVKWGEGTIGAAARENQGEAFLRKTLQDFAGKRSEEILFIEQGAIKVDGDQFVVHDYSYFETNQRFNYNTREKVRKRKKN